MRPFFLARKCLILLRKNRALRNARWRVISRGALGRHERHAKRASGLYRAIKRHMQTLHEGKGAHFVQLLGSCFCHYATAKSASRRVTPTRPATEVTKNVLYLP